MLQRGKFKSLIMINWNGFFARQYDLDNQVTTLSGGNGAGKSTTMAAFITALIPDLTLLHFRNTTEAGSTASSRDRGLYGKLKQGTCYAALECLNSKGQTCIFGARLQQVAGRDKKVDIKLFSLRINKPYAELGVEQAIRLFFDQVDGRGKILSLEALAKKYPPADNKKDQLAPEPKDIELRLYNSLGDYHGDMFDFGFLAKRLRSQQDRGRYYRLIEASLYGGISSTITKSLREYLLPENTHVRKAFQDMEQAIVENRQTLDKIHNTQKERDFFKSLSSAALDYSGAYYTYLQNTRNEVVESALKARKNYFELVKVEETLQDKIDSFEAEVQKLRSEYQAQRHEADHALNQLNQIQQAVLTQQQYNDQKASHDALVEELDTARYQKEEIDINFEEANELTIKLRAQIDSLNSQISDQSMAHSSRKDKVASFTRALDKQVQLVRTLVKAKEVFLTPEWAQYRQERIVEHFFGPDALEAVQADPNKLVSLLADTSAYVKPTLKVNTAHLHQLSIEQVYGQEAEFSRLVQRAQEVLKVLDNGDDHDLTTKRDLLSDFLPEHLGKLELYLATCATLMSAEVFNLHNALRMSESQAGEYERTLQAVRTVSRQQVSGQKAYRLAQELQAQYKDALAKSERFAELSNELKNLRNNLDHYKRTKAKISQLETELGISDSSYESASAEVEKLNQELAQTRDEQYQLQNSINQINHEFQQLRNRQIELEAIKQQYEIAQEPLENLRKKTQLGINTVEDCNQAWAYYSQQNAKAQARIAVLEDQITSLQQQLSHVENNGLGINQDLLDLAQLLDGKLLSEIYEDVSVEDGKHYATLYGAWKDAIVVSSLDGLEDKLLDYANQGGNIPDDLYFIVNNRDEYNEDILTFNEHEFAASDKKGKIHRYFIKNSDNLARLSKKVDFSTFGRQASEEFVTNAKARLEELRNERNQVDNEFYASQALTQQISQFVSTHGHCAFIPDPKLELVELLKQNSALQAQLQKASASVVKLDATFNRTKARTALYDELTRHLLQLPHENPEERFRDLEQQVLAAQTARTWLDEHQKSLKQIDEHWNILQYEQSDRASLQQRLQELNDNQNQLSAALELINDLEHRKDDFNIGELTQEDSQDLVTQLRQQRDKYQEQLRKANERLELVRPQRDQIDREIVRLETRIATLAESLAHLRQQLNVNGSVVDQAALDSAKAHHEQLQEAVQKLHAEIALKETEFTANNERVGTIATELKQAADEYKVAKQSVLDNRARIRQARKLATSANVHKQLLNPKFSLLSNQELRTLSDRAQGTLRGICDKLEDLKPALRKSDDPRNPAAKVEFFIAVFKHLRERIRQDIANTDDPIEAIAVMEDSLVRLQDSLEKREKSLTISTSQVALLLEKTIQKEQNRIYQLNQGLQNMAFGQVRSVRLATKVRDSHQLLLDALRTAGESHDDLFNNKDISFTEALAHLYRRTNVGYDLGQRSYQSVGEELLDYRNYIELGIEVFRGSDGWLKAESGALSTGEAIGTGMSILLMVVQSWEEESRRMRDKDQLPSRLLFLDEAARLDARSIGTLFELCQRQDMQLLIAAPENISPDNGTTYKLVRRVEGNKEYVSVVGMRGFGHPEAHAKMQQQQLPNPEAATANSDGTTATGAAQVAPAPAAQDSAASQP